MTLLAQTTVFWPGISKDIEKTRKTCEPCIHNAPSQPKSIPIPPVIPTTPFEAVVTDYFQFEGHHYLVVGDRLSAWTEVYHIHVGSSTSGSHGLITLLKNFFGTFGVPVELSSDQGKEYIADETQEFFFTLGGETPRLCGLQPTIQRSSRISSQIYQTSAGKQYWLRWKA